MTTEPYFYIREDLRKNIKGFDVPVLDENKIFHLWIFRHNELFDFKPQNIYEGIYLAKKSFADVDIYLEFVSFIFQKCYDENKLDVNAIICDAFNLAACLNKLRIFYEINQQQKLDVRRFVATEIEYIFITCRSLFDHLQRISAHLWENITLADKTINKKKIPPTFSFVYRDGRKHTIKEHKDFADYGLPLEWIEFYITSANTFRAIQELREDVIHKGYDIRWIYATERGFGIDSEYEPFKRFNVWKKEYFINETIAPVRPIICHVIYETFMIMNRFVKMLNDVNIQFPPDIAPGYLLFLRTSNSHLLQKIDEHILHNVWDDEKEIGIVEGNTNSNA